MQMEIRPQGYQVVNGKELGVFAVRMTGPGGYVSDYYIIAANHDEAMEIVNDGKATVKMRSRVGNAIFGKPEPYWEGE